MKESDILDSIGDISDSIIEDVLNYEPEKKSAKKISIKALTSIAVATALCIVLAVTGFANATGISAVISSLFRREQEYVDPYAQIINKSDTEDNILMTIRKVAKDGDNYILYLTLHNETEDFAKGYLTYDSIILDYKSRGETCHYGKLASRGTTEIAGRKVILAGVHFEILTEPTKDVNIKLVIPGGSKAEEVDPNICREWESGICHFEVNGLAVLPYTLDEEGLIVPEDEYIDYAEKLEVDFDYDTGDVEELPATVLYPNRDFKLDGRNYRVTRIVHTATSLKVTVEDMDKELLEYGDLHFWGTAKLDGYLSPVEYPWIPAVDDAGVKTGYYKVGEINEDGEFEEKDSKERWDIINDVKKEYKLYDSTYDIQVVFKKNSMTDCRVSEMTLDLWPLNPDGTVNRHVFEKTFYFSAATSLDDILSIDFLSWNYDYSGETPEPESFKSRTTGWYNLN